MMRARLPKGLWITLGPLAITFACGQEIDLGHLSGASGASTSTSSSTSSSTSTTSSSSSTSGSSTSGSSTSSTTSSSTSSTTSSSTTSSSSSSSSGQGGSCGDAGTPLWEPRTCAGSSLASMATGYSLGCAPISAGWQGMAIAAYTNGDVYRTFNGMAKAPTWQRMNDWTEPMTGEAKHLPHGMVTAAAVHPCNFFEAFVAFAATSAGPTLYRSSADGTWTAITTQPLAEVWGVAYNPIDPGMLYIVGADGAVAETNDGGGTWTTNPLADPITAPLAAGERISSVAMFANDQGHLLVGSTTGKLYLTTDQTTWSDVTGAGMPSRPITRVTASTSADHPKFFVTYAGISTDSVWSSDDGHVWQNIHRAPLPTTAGVASARAFFGVSVSPVDDAILFIDGTNGAGRSTDAGATWTWREN